MRAALVILLIASGCRAADSGSPDSGTKAADGGTTSDGGATDGGGGDGGGGDGGDGGDGGSTSDGGGDGGTGDGGATGPKRYVQIASGDVHICALDNYGAISCWGAQPGEDEDYGQVSETPADSDFVYVGVGFYASCGIHAGGEAECWGRNLGYESSPTVGAYAEIAIGYLFGCGIQLDGDNVCWGLDNPYRDPPSVPLRDIQAKVHGTCGIGADDSIQCWGYIPTEDKDHGQLDNIPTTGTWQHAAMGLYHACAVRTTGEIECWGYNSEGQAENNDEQEFVQVQAGDNFSIGLDVDGVAHCWGGYGACANTPQHIAFSQISSGYVHTCGLTLDGDIVCWGVDNEYMKRFPNWIGFGIPE